MIRGITLLALIAVAACGGSDSKEATPQPTSGSSTPPMSSSTTPSGTGARELFVPTEGVTRSRPDAAAPVDELAAGFNEAGFDLWHTQPADGNVVFSPISVGHALLMARGAAADPTAAAIDSVFGLPEGRAADQAWNAIDQAIDASQSDDVTVRIADRIWPRLGLQPDQAWIDLLAAEHGADVEALDLTGDPDGSREIINAWVSEQTEELIPDLLPDGFINPQTELVLTDAVYFEAKWRTPFVKYGTVDGTFTKLDGSEVDIELMRELELDDRRGRGDGFVGAELPYTGDDYSMLVIVPDEGRFEDVRDRLGQDLLDEIDANFTTGPYELLLPKWEDDAAIDLLPWLKGNGIALGSFPAISPDASLDAAAHAADIAVDEHGTVAAAATALGFKSSGPPQPELTVAADQPFLYLIRHRDTGIVTFAGQVVDPG